MVVTLFSCHQKESKNNTDNFRDPLAMHRDTIVSPGEDFFHYANGRWFKENPIPPSESYNGIFRIIHDTINEQIKRVCEESSNANAEKGSKKQKVGDFYLSGMDTVQIDNAGITPLNDEIAAIDAVTDINSLMNAIAHLHTIGASPAFLFSVGQDDKLSTKYALFFRQGGLGLGERDYYFDADEHTTNIRNEYTKHITAIFKLSGIDETTSTLASRAVMNIETELARNSQKLAKLRDPQVNYNKMSVTQFNKLMPHVAWSMVLRKLKVENADTVIIGQPEYFKALDVSLNKFSTADWKLYLKWTLINTYASKLSKPIDNQNFYFYSTVINGVKDRKPRWKTIVQETDSYLGELIGQVYVEEYLPKGTKDKLLDIANNIREVYADHIKKLDWMSDSTKAKALNKLSKIVMKVGYPDKWKDMSSLEINRNTYVENVMRANEWRFNFMINKYRKPVDRSEWFIYPQTYDAYYRDSNNEIVVPACNIIIPGFEGRMPDDAVLYGIIGGSIIGHEITHGFDDQGSQYDENGNLSDWWTKEDLEKFMQKTKLIVEQFNNYVMLDSLHINGEATQGENIADLGGVRMGYEAFRKTDQYKNNITIAGLTPGERYFLAYGYSWMVNATPQSMARRMKTDVHSPAQYRINGPLSNMPEFYKTFNIKEGDFMYRNNSMRIVIW